MIKELLKKLAEDFLEAFGLLPSPPPVSEPEPVPEPKLEPPPDPKQVAAELRLLADKLDPIVVPPFPVPEPPYKGWNTVMDESGDSGGKVKRKGAGVEMGKRPEKDAFDHEPLDQDILRQIKVWEHTESGGTK